MAARGARAAAWLASSSPARPRCDCGPHRDAGQMRWVILDLGDPVLGIERDQRGVGLMQEDLAVGIGKAAIDGVTTHDGNDVGVLLGLVLPQNLAIIIQVEREHRVRERPMHIHDIANDQRSAFMAAQDAMAGRYSSRPV